MLKLASERAKNKEQGYKIQHDPHGDIWSLHAYAQAP